MTTEIVGNRRLLRLADILDKADERHKARGEPAYNQDAYTHACGTPACALGHASADAGFRKAGLHPDGATARCLRPDNPAGSEAFFALSMGEDCELFAGYGGCGDAKTAKQAAAYIRKFVKRRQKAATP